MKRGMVLGLILAIGFWLRLYRLDVPENYIFDEVYHVPSFRAFSQNNPDAFDVYAQAPEEGTAYDWLHPPLAKLFQAGSIKLLGDNSFGWRFPSAVFGVLAIAAVYALALAVTKKELIALLAAGLFSLDNLQLTMSRIAMNDIFVTTFILFALAFFFKGFFFRAAIFTGLAIATKHSAVLLFLIYAIFLIKKKLHITYYILLITVPVLIYLLSFSQFWLQGHDWQQFIDLHKQIYYYQTHLTATHSYQSPAWQWPLLIRPVWFHVAYFENTVANIYNLGNPVIFWLGLMALIKGLSFAKAKVSPYWYLLLSFFGLWFPFIFSPRIMFLHHYLPALAVLTVILAQQLAKLSKRKIALIIILAAISFLFFYPINTAIPLPSAWLKYWFVLPSWR
ncbi:phospholipid carrier-dependent glycosyltransferase [Patescibacteria group bacterium]|nr:phospholipid carrier-dependent glycosyltransferase [Patescibacteria group bacterium]